MSRKSQTAFSPPARPLLIVLSGPSGVGKDAILARLKELKYPLEFVTTVTTRPRRKNEINDVHYHFVSVAEFQAMIKHNELLEYASVYGNWYGVPGRPVKQALDGGKDAIVKVDIQGATTIKKILPQAVFIFLMPPSMDELLERLKQRNTESGIDLDLRTKTAEAEIKKLAMFDYVVFNQRDAVDQAVAAIQAIITAEKCRVKQREINL